MPEIDFALARENDCSVITDLLASGELPVRVTHNDTKLNNVLFDNKTKKGICIVDLDTVMPGSSLYDFGDSIRFGANTAAEDEKDLSKVTLSLEYFKAYVDGYLEAAGESLTDNEIKYLPFSAKLLTFECGIRFLADFIDGDVYFKTEYPEHNLVRARTQFKLVADIEAKYDEMMHIVEESAKAILKDRKIF
jgi:Ser/Thr protein kinase RdoA (MazF antagonist)